jgi:hypothetical protein
MIQPPRDGPFAELISHIDAMERQCQALRQEVLELVARRGEPWEAAGETHDQWENRLNDDAR